MGRPASTRENATTLLRGFLAAAMLAVVSQVSTAADDEAGPRARDTFFELKIRPVLAGTCFKCHGGEKTSAELRVDAREALLKGGDTGPAIEPGDPEKSLLIKAIRRGSEDLQMPPDSPLREDVVKDFERWVKEGAHWPARDTSKPDPFAQQRHWAFQPVPPVKVPDDPTGWSANEVDRFIHARWGGRRHEDALADKSPVTPPTNSASTSGRNSVMLTPAPPADKRTLLRRVYFDLIGLPPTPDEMSAFLADDSPEAYPRVVEKLLESPHYGERWGRHWMDVVRYADTAGDNADYPIPEIRLYRDYIIDAFNTDKPYDQFVREQIAGDILAADGPREKFTERVVATGFLALSRRYATAPYELWHLSLEDTIDTVGRSFLGLSLRCARCHDHKFDPVTTADYYALYGIFSSTKFPYAGSEEFQSQKFPRKEFQSLLPPDEAAPIIEQHRQRVAAIKEKIARLEKIKDAKKEETDRLKVLRAELLGLERPGLPPNLPCAYAVADGPVADAKIQLRGEPSQPGETVPRGVPKFLEGNEPPGFPKDASGRRQLAEWLTRPDHPLTARVMVNRIWQGHFGKGIVNTPSNFGMRGDPPSHPELLDWLAKRFVDSGWSIKTIHRLIVLSNTYRMSSENDPHDASLDPGNEWYWRFDRQRLDAEAMRDAMLAASGELDLQRPGVHPFPPITQWNWTQHTPYKAVYPSNHRSVYLMTQRLQRHPYLALFDGPDTNTSTESRTSSVVPLQALFFMNSEFMRTTSEAFATRLIHASNDPRERVSLALQLAYARPPAEAEQERAVKYVAAYRDELARAGTPAERLDLEAWASYARTILTANEFRYVD